MSEKTQLIKIRTFLGLTQTQWGRLLGKGLSTIANWESESGKVNVTKQIRHTLREIGINDQYIYGKGNIALLTNWDEIVSNAKHKIAQIEDLQEVEV
jgi:DNA-binding XRE family transcriptional regulator